MNIHLIEKRNLFQIIDAARGIYESGFWAITEDIARAGRTGNIYFHKKQAEPSYRGGVILSYRVHDGGQYSGRIVFTFQEMVSHRNVITGKAGWRREKKIY